MKSPDCLWIIGQTEHKRGYTVPVMAFIMKNIFLAVVFVTVLHSPHVQGCGGFINIKDQLSGQISYPNYTGGPYPRFRRCVWFLEAPENHKVQLVVGFSHGEFVEDEGCVDFVEVRDGSSAEALLWRGCDGSGSGLLTSSSRWLWIYFKSNDNNITGSGFVSTWTKVPSERINEKDNSPQIVCINERYECPNKECIAWANRCDDYDDCGCDGEGCDEHGCGTFDLPWSGTTGKLGLGIGVGAIVFLIVFLGIGFLEIFLKKRAQREESDYKKKVEEQKRRAKQKKSNKQVAEIAGLVEKSEAVRLDVPTLRPSVSSASSKSGASSS